MNRESIVITGGCGYIGSHIAKYFIEYTDYNIIILDSLITGNLRVINLLKKLPNALDRITYIDMPFGKLSKLPYDHIMFMNVKAVFHLAALSSVGDSNSQPMLYWNNNVTSTIQLLDAYSHVTPKPKIIFSSTSMAVYPKSSVYARTKSVCETIIKDSDFPYTILRFFNASGCDMDGLLGECHNPETHLIPNLIDTLLGKKKAFSLYGMNYNTPDGTPIRNYIHVDDIASACFEVIHGEYNDKTLDLCTKKSYSVLEIIKKIEYMYNSKIPIYLENARSGDLSVIEHSTLDKFDWTPKLYIEDIIDSTYKWRRDHITGYRD